MASVSLLPAMALLLLAMAVASSDAQPSPGYYPSSRFRPVAFNRGYTNKWGPQHQTLSGDHSAITIWLDKTCGTCNFLSAHLWKRLKIVFKVQFRCMHMHVYLGLVFWQQCHRRTY